MSEKQMRNTSWGRGERGDLHHRAISSAVLSLSMKHVQCFKNKAGKAYRLWVGERSETVVVLLAWKKHIPDNRGTANGHTHISI